MKETKLLNKIASLFVIAANCLFISCIGLVQTGTDLNSGNSDSNNASFYINCNENLSSRTALPSDFSITSDDYKYTLIATYNVNSEKVIFTEKKYSEISSQAFLIANGTYNFELKVKVSDKEIFTAKILNKVMEGTGLSLNFILQPAAGFSSSATVTLKLPSSGVKYVKAGVASNPFAKVDECDYAAAVNVAIDTTNPSEPKVVYSGDFLSGRNQFVIFYIYDINDELIATVQESIVVVYGKTSTSVIVTSDYDLYNKVDYTLEVSGALTKKYYLKGETFDSSGITVRCKGSNGKQFVIDSNLYETNFDSLTGCSKDLVITFNGFSTTITRAINKADYEFTNVPEKLSDSPVTYKFGDYPQTKKADGLEVSWETAENGYYIGDDGCFYEKNGDYFKVEPIEWRVLNTKQGDANNYQTIGKAFLFAEKCIEAGKAFYGNKGSNRTINGKTVYSNNWEYSNIRAFLNSMNGSGYNVSDYSASGFYTKAFSSEARGRIYKTTVINDKNSNMNNSIADEYVVNNTEDKIFLLSEQEIRNTDYGFKSDEGNDSARVKSNTDYAKKLFGNDCKYWLRSQKYGKGDGWDLTNYKGDNSLYVNTSGSSSQYTGVNENNQGIIPALWVSLNGYTDALVLSGSLQKQYYLTGEAFDTTGLTVTYYDGSGNSSVLSSGSYTTNFNSLTGANSTLLISYNGLTAEVDQKVHRATYQMTESPRLSSHTSPYLQTTSEYSAVFYEFGDYPQSQKASDVSVTKNPANNGYYIGSDGNYYQLKGSNYYKVEPIIWRVLNAKTGSSDNYVTTGKALLFAEHCLEAGIPFHFNESVSANAPNQRRYSGTEKKLYPEAGESDEGVARGLWCYGYGAQIYPNNYEYSTIRAYLNGINASSYCLAKNVNAADYDFRNKGFLQKAFTEAARKKILRQTVSNGIESTVTYQGDTGPSAYTRTCPDTKDKVFLLSVREITNPDYGFNDYADGSDNKRKRYRTNYAEAGKVYTKNGFAHYMLRTPNTGDNKTKFRYVIDDGTAKSVEAASKTDKGIVPAIWISLNGTEDTTEVTTEPLFKKASHTAPEGSGSVTYTKSTELFNLVGEGYNNGEYGSVIIQKGKVYQNSSDVTGQDIYLITLSGTEIVDDQSTGIWTDLQSGFNGGSSYLTNMGYIITGDGSTYNSGLKDTSKYQEYSAGANKILIGSIPAGSNLIIAGHSLGGMISQQTSALDKIKDNYNVLNVITYGSPLLSEGSREGELHRMCDRSDLVPLASGSIVSSSQQQWLERECEDAGYGEEIYGSGGLTAHIAGASTDSRDVTGPHCYSYARQEVWGAYDVLGRKNGTAKIVVDLSTKTFYKNPS